MQMPRVTELSRVILIYRPENFAAAQRNFAEALGIADFEGPYEPAGFGLRFSLSFSARLELITPLGDAGFAANAWEVLKTRGEGFFGLVFGVPDLNEAEARAAAAGHERSGTRLDCLSAVPAWRARFSYSTESPLEKIAGIGITLIQSDKKILGRNKNSGAKDWSWRGSA